MINQKYGPKQNFTVTFINGSYMFQLQNNHNQAVYVRSIKRNLIHVVYILLKVFSRRYLGLTYKGIRFLHLHKHLQFNQYCIKLKN